MANEVYANGREIACKAASGKTTAAFPDTCLSPPSPPAGPVPIPYPNTAYAKDTSNGSTTVMISGQEVMLKDRSVFKTSTGNEAATRTLGMGVVTHTIQGEASFVAWSMDVKIEGQNVDRHLDMTVNNEQCLPADTPPWPYIDNATLGADLPCNKPAPKDYANQGNNTARRRHPRAYAEAFRAASDRCAAARPAAERLVEMLRGTQMRDGSGEAQRLQGLRYDAAPCGSSGGVPRAARTGRNARRDRGRGLQDLEGPLPLRER